jgi:hypothetical protein
MNVLPRPASPMKRITRHLNIPHPDIDRYLRAIEDAFGETWLCADRPRHRLRDLWRRCDALSTTELTSLGHAIATMNSINPGWVKATVRKIRETNGNCRGPIFELMACAMLASAGMKIYPMPNSHKGYDAEVAFNDGYKLRVSMKSHGMSVHERTFHERANKLRAQILRKLNEQSLSSRIIVRCETYPDESEFDALWKAIATAKRLADVDIEAIPGRATISFRRFPEEKYRLADGWVSDTVLIICGQHPNEQKRFQKNVNLAARKFGPYTNRVDDAGNVVFMHLHPSALIEGVAARAAEIFCSSNAPGFDAIWLYQPAVVRQDGDSLVSHHLRIEMGKRYKAEGVRMHTLIGGWSSEPSRFELHSDTGLPVPVVDRYLFQRGDIYLAHSESDESGGYIGSLGSGINVHCLYNFGKQENILLSLKDHEKEDLAIL